MVSESCNAVRMRFELLGVLGVVACAPTLERPTVVAAPLPRVATVTPATASPVSLPPPAVPGRTPITEQARLHARSAFSQALELWSAGRTADAQAMVELGLLTLARRLPEDRTDERLGDLMGTAAVSADGTAYALGDTETLLVADSATGRFMGLRVHDYAAAPVEPAISPQSTVVVAPSSSELCVYDSKGLALRLRIAARRDAPFAFLSEDKLVTVRLGEPSSTAPLARGQILQRSIFGSLQSPAQAGVVAPATEDESDGELSDDEIVIVDLRTGKTDKVLKLSAPPDQGLLRKVASLPPSRRCNEVDDCSQYELDPQPIGRRVEQLKVASGMVVAGWQGGATTFHRLRDGKLVGAFRSRGERWKPGLVAIWPKPPRAAVATSLPNVGRGNEPPFSVTALFDFDHGRLLEIIDECRWATGLAFSRDGTRLMVGDLRKACLHDARNGRYLETTEDVRASLGADDNLQDVSVRSIPEGRWLLTTADGTFSVFDEKKGRVLFRGKNDGREARVAEDQRSLFVADFSGGEAQLITFGPSGMERRLLRSEELEQKRVPPELADSPEGKRAAILEKLMQHSCLIEGFRLPIELCHAGAQ